MDLNSLGKEINKCLSKILTKDYHNQNYQVRSMPGKNAFLGSDENFRRLIEISKELIVGDTDRFYLSMTDTEREVYIAKIKMGLLERQTVALEEMASIMRELKGVP